MAQTPLEFFKTKEFAEIVADVMEQRKRDTVATKGDYGRSGVQDYLDATTATANAARTSPELPDYVPQDASMPPSGLLKLINRLTYNHNKLIDYLHAKESHAKDAEPIPDVPNVMVLDDDAISKRMLFNQLRDVVAALKRRAEESE